MIKNKFPGIRDPPKDTSFKYPEGGEIKGKVIKEVRKLKHGNVSGDYCMVIQLVEYPDNKDRIRFGYYRKKPGSKMFKWGSQTTFQAPVDFTKDMIKMAKKEGVL